MTHSCDSYELQEFDLVIHWCRGPVLCRKVAQEAFSPSIMIIADLWAMLPLCITGLLLCRLPQGLDRAQGGGGSTVPHIIIAKLTSMIPIPLSWNKWIEEKEGLTFQLLRLSIPCKKTVTWHEHLKLGRWARSGVNWMIYFKWSSHSAHICFQLS